MLALLTRDDGTVGRLPWVTCALVALVVVGYVTSHGASEQVRNEAEQRLSEARAYFEQNPYVEVDASTARRIGLADPEQRRLAYLEERRARGLPLIPPRIVQRTQRAFDTLVADAFDQLDTLPLWRSAVRDSSSPAGNYLTHVAFHDRLAALLISIFFLVVAGAALEDAWGPLAYAGLCLSGTLAGAVAFAWLHAGSSPPWIGASGLCAALVGAYGVRFARQRTHLLGVHVPFWLMPVLFAAAELYGVRGVPLDRPGAIPSLVPLGAVLAPMALGVAAALASRALGLDARLAQRRSDVPLVANPVLERAMAAREAGDDAQAFTLLQAALKERPGNRDAALALWDLALSLERAREATPVMVRLIRDELQSGDADSAVQHWLAVSEQVGEIDADPVLLVRIAERLLDAAHPENAVAALRRAVAGRGRPLASALALRAVRLARDLDSEVTLRAAQSALLDRELSPGSRHELETLVATLGERPGGPGAPVSSANSSQRASATAVAPGTAAKPAAPPDPDDLSALDPHALGLEAVQQETGTGTAAGLEFGAPGSVEGVDEEAMSRWNDPGLVEDLSAELPDAREEWREGDFSLESHGAVNLDPDEDLGAGDEVAPARPDPHLAEGPGEEGLGAAPTGDGWESPPDLLGGDPRAVPATEATDAPDEMAAAPELPAVEEPEAPAPAAPLSSDDLDTAGFDAPPVVPRPLRVLDVIPLALEDESVKFEVAGRGKTRVPWERIDAVGVAVVGGLGPKPVIVLDVALNWREGGSEPLKLLRLRSDRFNPRRLFPQESSALEALRRLVATVLDHSHAAALPHPDKALPETARGFARFDALADYEADVWHALRD